jgi:hypothetical protein
MVACDGTMAGSSGLLVQGLEHAMVHQTLHNLLLQDRNEMGIPFGLPSSSDGWHGEQVAVTSFTNP